MDSIYENIRISKIPFKIVFIIYLIINKFSNFFNSYNTDCISDLNQDKNIITFYNIYMSFKNDNLTKEFFKNFIINDISYTLSFKFRIVKMEYKLAFYNKYNNLISPSDLALYNNLHIICIIEILKSKIIIIYLLKINKIYQINK